MQFTVKFRTMGMTFFAGQFEAGCVNSAKPRATDLLTRRKLKSVEYAAILGPDGSEAALLNVPGFNAPGRDVEWLTVHK
jgi:hypothetical protein